MKHLGWLVLALVVALALFSACGSGSSDDDDAVSASDDTAADDDSTLDDSADDDVSDDDAVDDDTTADDTSDDDAADDDSAADDTTDDDTADDDTVACPDADADGFTDAACGGEDCNDADPAVHPGVYDLCGDAVDNDCDGHIDNPQDPPVDLPAFPLGLSQGGPSNAIQYLPQLGIHWYRQGISLRTVKPTVTDPDLTMADIEANPGLIDDFADEIDWTGIDNILRQLFDAGIQPLASVGLGWIGTLPTLDGETATPDKLGKDQYLAQMYRYVRAVVERYDGDGSRDADGIVIKVWQIENELNQAMITTLYGWREPTGFAGFTSAWADWDFLTELLSTLNRAVHESDPEAITTQNLHTDIHPNFSHLLLQPSWIEAATLWRDLMDVVGFDAYPNYYEAEPVHGDVVGERATTIMQASCGKPVMILETGYSTGPAELGFDEANQAQYIVDAFHAAQDAGVSGFLYFGLKTADTHAVVIAPEDIAAMAFLGPHFMGGEVLPILGWVLQNWDYVTAPHFLEVLQSVEAYWGVVRPDGTLKPGFEALQSIAEEVNP